jgi:FHA domain-containing protein/type VI secretion system protein
MPARHKARLWDRLVASYGDLVRDADDDLQRLFGEQFAIAYQQQVERLRGGHPPTSPASSHVVE